MSDFSFMPFGSAREVPAVIFSNKRSWKVRDMNIFIFVLKWLKFVGGGGVQFGVRKTIVGHKSLISYQ